MKKICSITLVSLLLFNCSSNRYLLSDKGKDKYYLADYIKAAAKNGEISKHPLVVVNGVPFTYEMLKEKKLYYSRRDIKEIEKLSTEVATKVYGPVAKNGTLLLSMHLSAVFSKSPAFTRYGNSLILLDNKPISKDELDKLDVNAIQTISVLKGTEEVKKVTAENYETVIVVHTKKD